MQLNKKFFTGFFTFILTASLIVFTSRTCYSAVSSKVLSKIPTTNKSIALTFDAGSDAGNTSKILDILAKYNAKSTFFLTGEFVASNSQLTKRIINEGHEIGNHSWDHPHFTEISTSEMKNQLLKTHNKIIEVTGKAPASLFRPPYGSYNSSVLQAAGEVGYNYTIMWTVDTLDWKGVSATEIKDKVMAKAAPGAISLMHVGTGAPHTPEALPGIIEELKSKGYTLKTVSQILSESSGQTTYVVQRGDTLYRIAQKFGVTVQDIVRANNIANPNLIYPGQVFVIPTTTPSRTYVVQRGDTLWGISRKFGVTVSAIVSANNISNPNLIYPGQVLVIP